MPFGNLSKGEERGGPAQPRSPSAGESGKDSGFGRRRERPDADPMRLLDVGSKGDSPRVPRTVSPPIGG